MGEPIQVTTTVDDEEIAARLARTAVEARLAACAQVGGPITSIYWWEGRIDEAREWVVVFKTVRDRHDALARHITEHHPYDVPEILATAVVAGDPAYLRWIEAETSGHSESE